MALVTYIFFAVYTAGALWLVVSGVLSLFTRQCTIWIGPKAFSVSGAKAILGGVSTVIVGILLLWLALVQFRAFQLHSAAG